jgi:hypothetical protein
MPFKFLRQLAFTSKVWSEVRGAKGRSDLIALQERLRATKRWHCSIPFVIRELLE